MPSSSSILAARRILSEHLPYRLGIHGRDEQGNCKLMLAIAEAIDASAKPQQESTPQP